MFLSYDNYEEPGFDGAKYVMSPPLREKWHQDVLWKGLAKNDLQVISTDHCPFCMAEQKELGKDDFSKIPNGAPGIETRLTLVHDGGVRPGRISMNRVRRAVLDDAARRCSGCFRGKERSRSAATPDIVIFDPEQVRHAQREDAAHESGLQPVRRTDGERLARPSISSGEVIIDGERFVGKKGAGPFPPPRPEPGTCGAIGRVRQGCGVLLLVPWFVTVSPGEPERTRRPRQTLRNRRTYLETARLFLTSNTPLTSRAFKPATDLSLSLSTTPSSVTRPFFTMMRIDGWLPKPYRSSASLR